MKQSYARQSRFEPEFLIIIHINCTILSNDISRRRFILIRIKVTALDIFKWIGDKYKCVTYTRNTNVWTCSVKRYSFISVNWFPVSCMNRAGSFLFFAYIGKSDLLLLRSGMTRLFVLFMIHVVSSNVLVNEILFILLTYFVPLVGKTLP